MTACRAARSRRARWTSCFRWRRFRRRSSSTTAAWRSHRARSGLHGRTRQGIGCRRSSNFCARRPPTISRSTSRERCSAGSSGAWRWRRSRPTTWIAISRCCAATRASSTCLPRTCSSTSPASSAIRRCSISWRRRSSRTWSATTSPDHPLRIWIAGCSTGEETYSLAMLFLRADRGGEAQHQAAGLRLRYRPGRRRQRPGGPLPGNDRGGGVAGTACPLLHRRKSNGYRVAAELRATVVFTVQDVLADPPFSRLDLVSCRNLLIYLRPEAQAKVISLFHFALREGGILLLGSSETVGNVEAASRRSPSGADLSAHRPQPAGRTRLLTERRRWRARPGARRDQAPALSRQAALAELCRRLVMETYAPAAVLINRKHECLYSLGPTDRYLRVASGHADARSARHGASGHAYQAAVGDPAGQSGERARRRRRRPDEPRRASGSFNIDVQPVLSEGESCCWSASSTSRSTSRSAAMPTTPRDLSQVAELEQELEGHENRNCRAPSAAWRFPAKSRGRSTKRHCPSTRNINRRTRSC